MKSSRLSDHTYLVPLGGDLAIISTLTSGKFWRAMGSENATDGFRLIFQFILFCMNVLAFSIRVFLRYKQGHKTMGWILTAYTAVVMIAYNWSLRPFDWIVTPISSLFYPIIWPIHRLIWWQDPDWWPHIFHDCASRPLQWMTVLFCILAVVHIITSYIRKKDRSAGVKRGIPVLWFISSLVIRRLYNTRDWVMWWILEAAIVIGIAYAAWFIHADIRFKIFLLAAALSHVILEAYEYFGLKQFVR